MLKKVDFSEWAAPVVVVPKQVQFCGDYMVTVNPVCDIDQYPLPRTDDLFGGKKIFTKLDLTHAYQQLILY